MRFRSLDIPFRLFAQVFDHLSIPRFLFSGVWHDLRTRSRYEFHGHNGCLSFYAFRSHDAGRRRTERRHIHWRPQETRGRRSERATIWRPAQLRVRRRRQHRWIAVVVEHRYYYTIDPNLIEPPCIKRPLPRPDKNVCYHRYHTVETPFEFTGKLIPEHGWKRFSTDANGLRGYGLNRARYRFTLNSKRYGSKCITQSNGRSDLYIYSWPDDITEKLKLCFWKGKIVFGKNLSSCTMPHDSFFSRTRGQTHHDRGYRRCYISDRVYRNNRDI